MRHLQNDPEKIRSFCQNHRSNMPPGSAFTYGLINIASGRSFPLLIGWRIGSENTLTQRNSTSVELDGFRTSTELSTDVSNSRSGRLVVLPATTFQSGMAAPSMLASIARIRWRHGRPICSVAPRSQAPKPHRGAPKGTLGAAWEGKHDEFLRCGYGSYCFLRRNLPTCWSAVTFGRGPGC